MQPITGRSLALAKRLGRFCSLVKKYGTVTAAAAAVDVLRNSRRVGWCWMLLLIVNSVECLPPLPLGEGRVRAVSVTV